MVGPKLNHGSRDPDLAHLRVSCRLKDNPWHPKIWRL